MNNNITEQKLNNQFINDKIYYENILLPVLDQFWFKYMFLNNPEECCDLLKRYSKHYYQRLTSGKDKDIIKLYDNIYIDIYNILTCSIINYSSCKKKLELDFKFIKDNINPVNNEEFIYTICLIFFFIDFYAFNKKKNL